MTTPSSGWDIYSFIRVFGADRLMTQLVFSGSIHSPSCRQLAYLLTTFFPKGFLLMSFPIIFILRWEIHSMIRKDICRSFTRVFGVDITITSSDDGSDWPLSIATDCYNNVPWLYSYSLFYAVAMTWRAQNIHHQHHHRVQAQDIFNIIGFFSITKDSLALDAGCAFTLSSTS